MANSDLIRALAVVRARRRGRRRPIARAFAEYGVDAVDVSTG